MPGIADYQKWIEEAKALIGSSSAEDLYDKRNNQIVDFLRSLQAAKSKEYQAILTEYEGIAKAVQKARQANDSKAIKKLNDDLKSLKDRAKKADAEAKSWREGVNKATAEIGAKTEEKVNDLIAKAEKRAEKLGIKSVPLEFVATDCNYLFNEYSFKFNALTPGSDPKPLAEEFKKKLADVVKAKEALIADDAKFKAACNVQLKAIQDAEAIKTASAVREKIRALDVSLRDLEDIGVDAKKIADLRKRVEVKTLEAAEAMSKEIAQVKTNHEAAQKKNIEAMKGDLKKLTDSIDAKKKELKGNDKAIEAMDELSKEAARLIKLAETNNPEAMAGARILAKQIEGVVNATKPGAGVAKVFSDMEALEKAFKNEDLQKYFASNINPLKDRLNQLAKNVDVFDLTAAESELESIRTQGAAITKEKDALLRWQGGIRKWLGTIHTMVDEANAALKGRTTAIGKKLGSLGDLMNGKKLKIAILLDDVEKSYLQPGADQAAIQAKCIEVNDRAVALKKAASEDDVAKLEKEYGDGKTELESRENTKKAEQDKHEEFKKKLEELQQGITKARETVKSSKGPEAELDSLEKMAGIAKTLEKNGDREGALNQIEIVGKRLKKVTENPGGFAVYETEELTQADKRWNDALKAVQKDLKALAAEASAVAGKNQDQVRKKIESALTGFSADAFKSAGKLIDETVSLDERKKIREQVLAQVRRQRDFLQNDPVIDLVRTSPFKARVSTAPIRQALDGLELNALRAVAAK
jgi:DNA repair exonuclease SbcCD ATPase subunit